MSRVKRWAFLLFSVLIVSSSSVIAQARIQLGGKVALAQTIAPATFDQAWSGIVASEFFVRYPVTKVFFVGPTAGYSYFTNDKDLLPAFDTHGHFVHISAALGFVSTDHGVIVVAATGEIGYTWIMIRDSSVDLELDEGGVLLKPAVEVLYMVGPDVGIGLRTSISVILGADIWEEDNVRFYDYGLVFTWKI